MQELDGLLVADTAGDGGELGEFQGSVEADGFEQDASIHVQNQVNRSPLVVADVGLFEEQIAAFFEFAEDAPGVVDVVEAFAFKAGDALLGHIDPEFAGHGFEGLGFYVLGIEVGVGLEAEAVAGALRSVGDTGVLVVERIRQGAHDFSSAFGVVLFAYLAMALHFRVGGEFLEAGVFGLLFAGGKGNAVDGDEAGDVAVFGFDDELGGGKARTGFAQPVLHGMAAVIGGEHFGLQDATHDGFGLLLGQGAGSRRGGAGEWLRGGSATREQGAEQGRGQGKRDATRPGAFGNRSRLCCARRHKGVLLDCHGTSPFRRDKSRGVAVVLSWGAWVVIVRAGSR